MSGSLLTHAVFSVVLHTGVFLVLLIYLPLRLLYRFAVRVFVAPCLPEPRLDGKAVLITGASSGIGEALAYEYARKGASLALTARTRPALMAVAKAARDLGAPSAVVIPADVSNPDEAKRVVDEAVAALGRLDHVVANAGVWSNCLFDEVTNITAFHKLMDVNFWGAVYIAYYAMPHLKATGGNFVVNSSTAGRVPPARTSFYNASKAALIRFFETVRAECGAQVTITILMPGYVASDLTRGKGLLKDGEVGVNENARDIMVGPFAVGRSEDLARVAVRSACRGEAYVTWPRWYGVLHAMVCVAPEFFEWLSHRLYVASTSSNQVGPAGSGGAAGETLSQKLLRATGGKKVLYPPSIRCSQAMDG